MLHDGGPTMAALPSPEVIVLVLAKIVVTSAMVLALATINERVGPRVAGVLAGFPLGIAVSLFFIGIEQGSAFAATAAQSSLGGLGAALVFGIAYWRLTSGPRPFGIVLATLGSFAAFLASAALIGLLPVNRWLLTGVTLAIAALAAFIFRSVARVRADELPRIRVGPRELCVRAGIATALVLVITTLAGVVGEKWAGLLTGVPVTLYPLLLIAQLSYSPKVAHAIIEGFPYGIGGLVVCALVASYSLAAYGVYWGMMLAILAAGLYLAAVCAVVLRTKPAVEPAG